MANFGRSVTLIIEGKYRISSKPWKPGIIPERNMHNTVPQ